MVYVWVVGGVLIKDETDRVWSEALYVSVTRSNYSRLLDIMRYQGSSALISRLNMNIDIYTIHIASTGMNQFSRLNIEVSWCVPACNSFYWQYFSNTKISLKMGLQNFVKMTIWFEWETKTCYKLMNPTLWSTTTVR